MLYATDRKFLERIISSRIEDDIFNMCNGSCYLLKKFLTKDDKGRFNIDETYFFSSKEYLLSCDSIYDLYHSYRVKMPKIINDELREKADRFFGIISPLIPLIYSVNEAEKRFMGVEATTSDIREGTNDKLSTSIYNLPIVVEELKEYYRFFSYFCRKMHLNILEDECQQ